MTATQASSQVPCRDCQKSTGHTCQTAGRRLVYKAYTVVTHTHSPAATQDLLLFYICYYKATQRIQANILSFSWVVTLALNHWQLTFLQLCDTYLNCFWNIIFLQHWSCLPGRPSVTLNTAPSFNNLLRHRHFESILCCKLAQAVSVIDPSSPPCIVCPSVYSANL